MVDKSGPIELNSSTDPSTQQKLIAKRVDMDIVNWQFWSAVLWLVGSAWQATSSLLHLRRSVGDRIHSAANIARGQVMEAWQTRNVESRQFADENNLSPDLVGTKYTDIFALSEDLGSKLREQRAALIRSYRSAFVGWTVIFAAAALGVVGVWPT